MALLWKKTTAAKSYEVRQAGNSLRLYTDGTFHSQYNPRFPLGGNIWDLLVLPALFRPAAIRRVLVLGVGGGAVLRQLLQLVEPVAITGVELDPVHIRVANRYFGLAEYPSVSLHLADARSWLENYRGAPFDMIVDDLFVENRGDPRRAFAVDRPWARQLMSHLGRRGVLAVNFESARALRESALNLEPALRHRFPGKFSLSVAGYDNRIGAFFREDVRRSELTDSLGQLENRFGKTLTSRLTARLRRL